VLEHEAVAEAQVLEAVRREPSLHLVGERQPGEQREQREVETGGIH